MIKYHRHERTSVDQPYPSISRTMQYKKYTKPLLERKRRARFNRCLDELKDLMVGALEAEGENINKLEKADILELTVRHLQRITRPRDPIQEAHRFQAGFSQCASEACAFLLSLPGLDDVVGRRLVDHLKICFTAPIPGRPYNGTTTPDLNGSSRINNVTSPTPGTTTPIIPVSNSYLPPTLPPTIPNSFNEYQNNLQTTLPRTTTTSSRTNSNLQTPVRTTTTAPTTNVYQNVPIIIPAVSRSNMDPVVRYPSHEIGTAFTCYRSHVPPPTTRFPPNELKFSSDSKPNMWRPW